MNDQIRVRVGNCIKHVEKKTDPSSYFQHAAVTVPVNRFAFNMLKYQIGISVLREPGIQQLRNVRMREPPENCSLALKSLFTLAADQSNIQDLACYAALKASVTAFCEPDNP